MYRLTFNRESEDKIRNLRSQSISGDAATLFWKELDGLVEEIARSPTELGEPKYDHKFVKLRSYLVVRRFIAIQFAVSEEFQFVFVERVNLSGKHPYPLEFERILNPADN